MRINRRTVRIEWGDCDPAGIVYFPRYLAFCDDSTAHLFESVGLSKREVLRKYDLVGVPMVDLRTRFLIPSRFCDEIVIESEIYEWGCSSFKVRHRLMRDTALAVESFETRVWTGRDPQHPEIIKSKPIPEEFRALFS